MVGKTTTGMPPKEASESQSGISPESLIAKKMFRIQKIIASFDISRDKELLLQELNTSTNLVSSLDVIMQKKFGNIIEPIFSDIRFKDIAGHAIKLVEGGADVATSTLISFMEREDTSKEKIERLVHALVSSPHKTKLDSLKHHLETTENFNLLLTIFSSPEVLDQIRILAGKGILRLCDASIRSLKVELKKTFEMALQCSRVLKALDKKPSMAEIVEEMNRKLKEISAFSSIVKSEKKRKYAEDLKVMFSDFKQTGMEIPIVEELIKIFLDKENELEYRFAALEVCFSSSMNSYPEPKLWKDNFVKSLLPLLSENEEHMAIRLAAKQAINKL